MIRSAEQPAVLDPDADAVRRVQVGDHAAFGDLFARFHEPLCNFAHAYVGSAQVAQDLVQDVFANLWRLRSQWQPEGTVRAYLYRAVRNRTITYHEHRTVEMSYQEEYHRPGMGPSTPLENLSYSELAAEIQEAIRELPERRQHIFVLNRIHRLTYAEIATALDVSENTVDTQMRRALATLRTRFQSYLE